MEGDTLSRKALRTQPTRFAALDDTASLHNAKFFIIFSFKHCKRLLHPPPDTARRSSDVFLAGGPWRESFRTET